MTSRRVVFRADANQRIGFGHFMRSSALMDRLKGDFECRMVSLDPDSDNYTRLHDKFTEEVGPDDIVVLDNYYFNTNYQRLLRERAAALVCIDDLPDRHYVADIFLTFSPLERERFSLEPYTRFYGGIDRAFLREPFLKPAPERMNHSPRHALLAIGGTDPLHLTNKILRIIQEIYPYIDIDVISRSTVNENLLERGRVKVWSGLDATQMADMMDRADFGIFPASTVCVEAFSRRLPVAAGYFVDNQIPFYTHGSREKWWLPLGDLRADSDSIRQRFENKTIPLPPDFDFAARNNEIKDIFKSLCS